MSLPKREEAIEFRLSYFTRIGNFHTADIQVIREHATILISLPVYAPHGWLGDMDTLGKRIRALTWKAMEKANQMYMATTRGLSA